MASRRSRSPSQSHEPHPDAKRQKLGSEPNGSPAKDTSGALAEMPFDVLTEVFKNLEPVDLLVLLRTCLFLRTMLLNRPVASLIWKHAFSSAQPPPPPCPDDLTLPQYANVLYGNCHYCDASDGLHNAWLCYMRVCDDCLAENFVEIRTDRRAGQDLYNVVPSYTKKGRYGPWQDVIMCPGAEYHLKSQQLLKSSRSKKAYSEFVSRESDKLSQRKERSKALYEWEAEVERFKKEDIEARHRARRDAFSQRISNLREGYEMVFNRLISRGAESEVPGLSGVDPLTSDDWENVRPKVVEALQSWRQTFKEQDRTECIAHRTTKLLRPVYDYYISHNRTEQLFAPPYLQVAGMEPFRALIYDTPSDEQLTQSDFLAHLDVFPHLIEAWREEVVEFLLRLLGIELPNNVDSSGAKRKGKEHPLDSSVLEKASTIFKCSSCSKLILYPAVFSHRCFIFQPNRGASPNRRWNETGNEVQVHEGASRYTKVIIRAFGQDPDTVTWKQLEEGGQRLECLRCRHKVSRKCKNKHNCLVMNWRQAVLHELEKHSDEDSCETGWRLLDSQSLATAISKEIQGLRRGCRTYPLRENHEYCLQCVKIPEPSSISQDIH